MQILSINKNISDGIISQTIVLNYEIVASDFGLEATANLVNAFNTALIETLEILLDDKYQENSYASVVNGDVKFMSNNNQFNEIIVKLINALNKISENIIFQIKEEDLLLEDEQKEFFNRIISYELLHIVLVLETEKIRGGGIEDKKQSKI